MGFKQFQTANGQGSWSTGMTRKTFENDEETERLRAAKNGIGEVSSYYCPSNEEEEDLLDLRF
jgi:hypothetical protein